MKCALRVGLTGGIGSGKTTVSRMFAELGVPIIDADEISRALTSPGGAAHAAVARLAGSSVLDEDGTLKRDELRRRAFEDPALLKRLEAVIHPLVRAAIEQAVSAASYPYCMISIPLLVETGAADTVDRVLVVDLPEKTQIERAASRDGSDRAGIERIMAQQAGREVRLAAADDVISNDGDLATLRSQVEGLHAQYLAAAVDRIAAGS